jgi:hypothetical protein
MPGAEVDPRAGRRRGHRDARLIVHHRRQQRRHAQTEQLEHRAARRRHRQIRARHHLRHVGRRYQQPRGVRHRGRRRADGAQIAHRRSDHRRHRQGRQAIHLGQVAQGARRESGDVAAPEHQQEAQPPPLRPPVPAGGQELLAQQGEARSRQRPLAHGVQVRVHHQIHHRGAQVIHHGAHPQAAPAHGRAPAAVEAIAVGHDPAGASGQRRQRLRLARRRGPAGQDVGLEAVAVRERRGHSGRPHHEARSPATGARRLGDGDATHDVAEPHRRGGVAAEHHLEPAHPSASASARSTRA